MQGSGWVEGGVAGPLDWMKIDCSAVWGGWCRSPRRIGTPTSCYDATHSFSGYRCRGYDQMGLDSRGSHWSRYWRATTR